MSGLNNIEVRPGGTDDLALLSQIQAASPEASQWDVPEYLKYDLTVAVCDGRVAGFAAARRLAEGESELLNLAVDPAFRRHGFGRRLVSQLTSSHPGMLWLEVRESNTVARKFYESLGFCETGRRPGYYPPYGESAIVMKVHS
jgi:ribosomal-protein-alanine N-acetyltransferase